jgi:D-alanine-D-alanine ligase
MVFLDYPENKPRVLGYSEKWHEDSEEYRKTIRTFGTLNDFPQLEKQMKSIALRCWEVFGLRGYARVDFRVDEKNHPYVIEINGNPCISPNAGFIGADRRMGISQTDVVRRIMDDLNY